MDALGCAPDGASITANVIGNRCDGEVLHEIFTAQAVARPHAVAVSGRDRRWSYSRLDRASNQLAHYLRGRGLRHGDRVAMLSPRTSDMYLATLAVLKSGAACVPLDPEDPPDRVAYILRDCGAHALVTVSSFAKPRTGLPPNVIALDVLRTRIDEDSAEPLSRDGIGVTSQDPCYVMYSSVPAGRPVGIPIAHGSLCNLIRTQQQIFEIHPDDRVYQGSSIASDASVQEIWLAFAAGARLVVGGSQMRHAGPLLSGMLTDARITVLSCVPALLAMMDEVVPTVRLLILRGEPCPAEFLKPWCRPGRRVVNTTLVNGEADDRKLPDSGPWDDSTPSMATNTHRVKSGC